MSWFLPIARPVFLAAFAGIISLHGLASEADFISPYGNSSYFKKRASEKDFSFAPEFDFSLQYNSIGGDSYLLTNNWKNKTILERITIRNNRYVADSYYVKTNGSMRQLIAKGFVIADRNNNAGWNYTDPETGIELSCSSRLSDTVFNGVQRLSSLTIFKKGKGLSIKEVYIEGYGLCILVVNGVIYTQMMGDYDMKKDMMTTMGYTDPMACLLVNDENSRFFTQKMDQLVNDCQAIAARGRLSTAPLRAEWLKKEQQLRILAATMTRGFRGTDYRSFTERSIAFCYSAVAGILISNLQKDTGKEEQLLLLQAHRLRLWMVPSIDYIGTDFLKGENWVKFQLNYCRSIKGLASLLTDSLLIHPFTREEIEYLYELNSAALKTTWPGHVREQMVKNNQFLLEFILALSYQAESNLATVPYYKNAYQRSSFKFALSALQTLAENKDSTANEINTLSKNAELALISILDEIGDTGNSSSTPDRLWILMCRLKDYPRAFNWFKKALPHSDYMYTTYNLPLLKNMVLALNNAGEVATLILNKNKEENDKPVTTDKALVLLELKMPGAAIELIRNVKWGPLEFFADEVAGRKVLQRAFELQQQSILDYFYSEITTTYTLGKTPKKQYNQEVYDRLVIFSQLAERYGNQELSSKIYHYYQDMWKYR